MKSGPKSTRSLKKEVYLCEECLIFIPDPWKHPGVDFDLREQAPMFPGHCIRLRDVSVHAMNFGWRIIESRREKNPRAEFFGISRKRVIFALPNDGALAEWLGAGLQNLSQWFDSATHLLKPLLSESGGVLL